MGNSKSTDRQAVMTETLALYQTYAIDTEPGVEVFFLPLFVDVTSDGGGDVYRDDVTTIVRETLTSSLVTPAQTFVSGEGLIKELLRVAGPFEKGMKHHDFVGMYTVLNKEEYTVRYAIQRVVDGQRLILSIVVGIYQR